MPLPPDKMHEMTELASEVMRPVLQVAARQLVQSMEEIHESTVTPLREEIERLRSTLMWIAASSDKTAGEIKNYARGVLEKE